MADFEGFVLLDIKGLVRHAYHIGTDPEGLLGADGKPYNTAVWGLAKLLETYQLFEDIPPRNLIAVWDGGNNYRRMLWPEYKAKRAVANKEVDEVKKQQLATLDSMVEQMLRGLGATQVVVPGVEADDTIAMLCQKLHTNTLIIHTVDADLLALAAQYDRVKVLLKNALVEDEYKSASQPAPVPLSLIRLNKSIVGDSSDEYPGVVGMGDKAWLEMHTAFGTDGMLQLETIINNRDHGYMKAMAEQSGDKYLLKLNEQFEHWNKQYQLAKLNPDICEGVDGSNIISPEWTREVPSHNTLHALFHNAGLMAWYERLTKWCPRFNLADRSEPGGECLAHFRDHIKDGPISAFDYESYDPVKHEPFQRAKSKSSGEYVDVLSQKITGVSFCYGDNYQHVVYMPCRHREKEGVSLNYLPTHVAWAVNHAASSGPLIAHNASFETNLTVHDLKLALPGTIWDTYIMACYVEEDLPAQLKDLSLRWFGYIQETYKQVLERYGVDDMSQLTGADVLNYGCDDSLVTAHLFDLFWLITTIEGTWNFIREREFEFVHEQVRAFQTGVNVDVAVIHKLDEEATVELETSMDTLKQGLMDNCSQINEGGATVLYYDLMELEEAKAADEVWGDEKLTARRQKVWERCYEGSRYIPYQEIRQEVSVKPTPKPLTAVATKLGFSNPVIEKVTKSFLCDTWMPVAMPEAEAADIAGLPDKLRFVNRIRDVVNAKSWKKYESDEYLALAGLCSEILEDTAKVETIGDELNFNSPNQMQELLYCKFGLPIRVRSKIARGSARHKYKQAGAPSTDAKAVDMALANDVPDDDWRRPLLLAYRSAKTVLTAKSLFFKPIPLWVHPEDGMTHPQIKNCGTVTHRPSGTAYNLLQITKKDNGKLRSAFKPRKEDQVIVSADFNGQELRVLTSECKDPVLLDAYTGENKKDVHSVTAAAISNAFLSNTQWLAEHDLAGVVEQFDYEKFVAYLKGDDPTWAKAMGDIRKAAKGVNFLIVYMGGHDALARNIMVSSIIAKELMKQTFNRYPRISEWQKETIAFAREHGYTQTAYGNRRHLGSGLFSKDDEVRSRLERQGVNSVIQGTAADILKMCLSEAHRRRLFTSTGSTMIAPIYDEFVSTVPRAAVLDYCFGLKEIMEITPPNHAVPMVAEFSLSSTSWGEVIEIGSDITEDNIISALEGSQQVA
ncbi:MAG: DNA polymerase [Pseudomonadota bacterium]|nr:DNA polymerase [Pseudomonadota bacterium]